MNVYRQRLQILHDHIKMMETEENRDIDGNTFELGMDQSDEDRQTGEPFQIVVHVHCPSIYLTNQSRNVSRLKIGQCLTSSLRTNTGILTEIESEKNTILPTSEYIRIPAC